MNGLFSKIISITELRRKFGEVTENLAKTDAVILTKGGEPFAILKAAPEEKRKLLIKTAGAWKDTALDNDILWKKVSKKKSRKKPISL
ncbi:hypothetical protein HYS92_01340 [Candidatus Daviesbacteria bacterium]|nr:hypothetical protein [Candidatus Daviesbacteria bacterium]